MMEDARSDWERKRAMIQSQDWESLPQPLTLPTRASERAHLDTIESQDQPTWPEEREREREGRKVATHHHAPRPSSRPGSEETRHESTPRRCCSRHSISNKSRHFATSRWTCNEQSCCLPVCSSVRHLERARGLHEKTTILL
jgi:hypothetical protein